MTVGRSRALTAPALALIVMMFGLMPATIAIESSRLKYGEVVTAQQVLLDAPKGSGKRNGATIGAIVGFALADGGDRWLGAAIGGVVGGAVGSGAQKKKGWHLGVRLSNGGEIGVDIIGLKEHFAPGDKVRLLTLEDGRVDVFKRKPI